MLSRIVAAPFILGLFIVLYIIYEKGDTGYALYLAPIVVSLAAVYILQPQIDWWYYKRNPPELDEPIQLMLVRHCPFYNELSAVDKKRFRERIVMYSMAVEFVPKGFDTMSEDIKSVVAANLVHLTFGKQSPEYRMEPYEKFIIYPGPFPSPQYPEHFHASEVYHEDKVLLFAAHQLLASYLNSRGNYNLGLHELSKVQIALHPNEQYPDLTDEDWNRLEKVSGFSKSYIESFVGLPEVSILPVAITCLLTFPAKFQSLMPTEYEALVNILNFDPITGKRLIDFSIA